MFNTLEMRCVDKGFGVFKLQKALCNAFSSQKELEKSARGAVVQVHPFSYMPDLSFSFCREKVVQIVIGNFSCKRVTSFVLSNFPKLVKLEIGRGCFHSGNPENTPEPYNSSPQEKERSSQLMFLVSYCDNLTSITMRQWSFTRFNKVRISNLKSLKTLCFGIVSSVTTILKNSNNFYYAESLTLSSTVGFDLLCCRSSFVRRFGHRKCEFL